MKHVELIQNYYKYFNEQNIEGMLSCLHSDFTHDVNESSSKNGKETFKTFLKYMNEHYLEKLENIIIMSDGDNNLAAKFIVNGKYLKTDGQLPQARGQEYKIPAAQLFEVKDNLIHRVTTYYNLKDWIQKVQ